MLFEYRSDDRECLGKMKAAFDAIIEAYRATGIEVEVELLGERPCGGELDPVAYNALIDRVKASIQSIVGEEPSFGSGSTDANYPLSKGIPAACIGACTSVGAHTREEWVDLASLLTGTRFLLDFVSNYFEV